MSNFNQLAEYAATLEALVFASDKPVRDRELQHHLPDDINVADVISLVMQRYDDLAALNYAEWRMAGHFVQDQLSLND